MAKKKYPFSDRDFSMMLTGRDVKGASWPPRGGFTGGNSKNVNFNLSIKHPDVKEGFYEKFDYKSFYEILQTIRLIATIPGEAKAVKQCYPTYFKDGEHRPTGTTIAIIRAEDGSMWLAVKSKKIPTCHFELKSDSMRITDNDGNDIPPRERGIIGALAFADRMRDRAKWWCQQAIDSGEGQESGGGGYGGGNGGGGGNSGGQGGGNNSGGGSGDWDDDIPF